MPSRKLEVDNLELLFCELIPFSNAFSIRFCMHPIAGALETKPLLDVAVDTASQPIVNNTLDRHFQSVRVITSRKGEEDRVVSQWKPRNGGDLELPMPLPGATYVLEVCISDENRVKIPIGVAAFVPQYPPEQS